MAQAYALKLRQGIREISDINLSAPGKYVLYKSQHFNSLKVFGDGTCSISVNHRPEHSICRSIDDVDLNVYDMIFEISPLTTTSSCPAHSDVRVDQTHLAQHEHYDCVYERDATHRAGQDLACYGEVTNSEESCNHRVDEIIHMPRPLRVTPVDLLNPNVFDAPSDEHPWYAFMISHVSTQSSCAMSDVSGGSTTLKRRLEHSKVDALARRGKRMAVVEGLIPRLLHESQVPMPISPDQFSLSEAPDVDVLRFLHPHPRDLRIKFTAANHIYQIDGNPTNGSVTGMVHSFCKAFDPDEAILRMRSGAKWPREGYLRETVAVETFARLHICCPALLTMYACRPRDDASIAELLRHLRCNQDIEDEIAQLVMSPAEIKGMWANNGREAAHYGTYMHYLFEAHLNGYDVPTMSVEFRLLQAFLDEISGSAVAWRTEWTIFGDAENLAGSIDFCARLHDGTYMLVDWKRTSGLRGKFGSAQKMMYPLQHLPDCAGMQYRLQLNAYRYILEKYYSLSVSRMLIVCCHPENGSIPLVDEVARLEPETESMMARWRDANGGSSRPTESMLAKRWAVWQGTQQQHAHFFADFPRSLGVLPSPENFQSDSKRTWERRMYVSRNLLLMLDGEYTNKNYILFIYIDNLLKNNKSLLRLFHHTIVHPMTCKSNPAKWFGDLIEFLVTHVSPQNYDCLFLRRDALGGSQDSLMPAIGEIMEVEEEGLQDSLVPVPALVADPSQECAASGREDAQLVSQELEELLEEVPRSEALERARKRRHLPGAASTTNDFHIELSRFQSACESSLKEAVAFSHNSELTIVQHVQRLRQWVLERISRTDDNLVRLAVGALSVYRLRLWDMHIREHVLLLWIVEGEEYMRCHSGNLYFYQHGAFAMHRGIPPQATLSRCKKYLLVLEGFFRLVTSNRLDNDQQVMDEIEKLLAERNSARELLQDCETAALRGQRCKSQRGRPATAPRQSDEHNAEEVLPDFHDSGPRILADALSKVGSSMQRQLLEDKIFNLVVEWCDTPQIRSAGCSYQDCAVMYDTSADRHVSMVGDSPSNNIYLHIAHPLLGCRLGDPVLQNAEVRLSKFYAQTFWLNNEATWIASSAACLLFNIAAVQQLAQPRCLLAIRPLLLLRREERTLCDVSSAKAQEARSPVQC